MNASDEHTDQSGREEAAVPTNMVYGAKDPNLQAHCIYFYYLTEDKAKPEEYMRAFVIQKPSAIMNIESEIVPIIKAIKDGSLKPSGWSLGDIRWRRKSYIVVALEHPTHKLTKNDAVTFSAYGSFRGGNDYDVSTSYEFVTCFYCENHMKDGAGGPLTDYVPVSFKMVVKHAHPHGGPIVDILDHSDTGTNMGPPIGPP